MPKGWRTKEAAWLARQIRAANGQAELNGQGHITVTGPLGSTVVASAPHGYGSTWPAMLRDIARTGLVIGAQRPEPKAGRSRRKPARRATAAKNPKRTGMITRWLPGETSGFITDDEGESWFVSWDDVPGRGLPEGTAVTFTGDDVCTPGKPYPRAFAVRISQQHQEGKDDDRDPG